MKTIFIGYDSHSREAYDVCRFSLRNRSKEDLQIFPVGAFHDEINRPFHRTGVLATYDAIDGKPFSTDFSFSRFLVPYLARNLLKDDQPVLYVDSDFLFLRDVGELFNLADRKYAVQVVKNTHIPTETQLIKMHGVLQTRYHRKNWSSLMLFNIRHATVLFNLTPEAINTRNGGYFHQFHWCEDENIGELPADWNHLVGVLPYRPAEELGAVHFTLGGPWYPANADMEYADIWREEWGKNYKIPHRYRVGE